MSKHVGACPREPGISRRRREEELGLEKEGRSPGPGSEAEASVRRRLKNSRLQHGKKFPFGSSHLTLKILEILDRGELPEHTVSSAPVLILRPLLR